MHTFRVVKWTKIAILRLATTMYVLAALRVIQRMGWKQMLIGESCFYSYVSSQYVSILTFLSHLIHFSCNYVAEEAHHMTFRRLDGLDPQCGIGITGALDALMA